MAPQSSADARASRVAAIYLRFARVRRAREAGVRAPASASAREPAVAGGRSSRGSLLGRPVFFWGAPNDANFAVKRGDSGGRRAFPERVDSVLLSEACRVYLSDA